MLSCAPGGKAVHLEGTAGRGCERVAELEGGVGRLVQLKLLNRDEPWGVLSLGIQRS